MMTDHRETLSQIMNKLKTEGYDDNIPTGQLTELNPLEWVIDSIHRFEGESNPSDNSILFAISRKDGAEKMMLVNAYGMDSKKDVSNFVDQITKGE